MGEKVKNMTEFSKSQWAKTEFAQEYRDSADVYIVERKRLFEILKSFINILSPANRGTISLTLDVVMGL